MRCGGGVKWTARDTVDYSYDSLVGVRRNQKIVAIDAAGSSISGTGFRYLEGLTHVESIILSKNSYLHDDALAQLVLVKESLRHLEVSNCVNITDIGVRSLASLINLQSLILKNLMNVKDMSSCDGYLKENLPSSCRIECS